MFHHTSHRTDPGREQTGASPPSHNGRLGTNVSSNTVRCGAIAFARRTNRRTSSLSVEPPAGRSRLVMRGVASGAMRIHPQLLGRGLRRSLALVCVLIMLGFSALEVLHSHPAEMRSHSAQDTPCWICHVGHTTNPAPYIALSNSHPVCFRLVSLPSYRPSSRFDGLRNSIRPPPSR